MQQTNKNYVAAKFWTPFSGEVKCMLCPNKCFLKEGHTGPCGTRGVIDGNLVTFAYGNPCTIHIDPIEKKPLYHFFPGQKTFSIAIAGCNLHCRGCQNAAISQEKPGTMREYSYSPQQIVDAVIQAECKSISFTYSEPVASYEYLYDTAQLATKQGIKTILVSAGYINTEPLESLLPYISAANIDLKIFDEPLYWKFSKAHLKPVLETLKTILKSNTWLEITNLLVPGWNTDEKMIKKMCAWLKENGFENVPLHFSRFHPANQLLNIEATSFDTLQTAKAIALDSGLNLVYIGNAPEIDNNSTLCSKCKHELISRHHFTSRTTGLRNGKCDFCGSTPIGVWV